MVTNPNDLVVIEVVRGGQSLTWLYRRPKCCGAYLASKHAVDVQALELNGGISPGPATFQCPLCKSKQVAKPV